MSSHGSPYPLGATCIDGGVNFALFSANADQVTLCLFDQNGQQQQIPVTRRSGDIWHVHVPGISEGQVYGYRVGGPWRPESGQRFNPNKLLLDPYAKSLTRVPTAHVLSYDYQMVAGEMVPDTRDNAAEVAKSVVVQEAASLASSVRVPLADSLIYELHVKGFTRMHPDLPALDRGRYAGLRHPRVIDYLKDLGVTSLELLPVHEFVDEPFLTERGLTNYWGYNSIAFFAPTRRYARHEPIGEFRAMVEQLHDAGIEVILDVVYNHTAEGNHLGPTFSYRGIDNTSYYRLETGNPGINANDSGCGNSPPLPSPSPRKPSPSTAMASRSMQRSVASRTSGNVSSAFADTSRARRFALSGCRSMPPARSSTGSSVLLTMAPPVSSSVPRTSLPGSRHWCHDHARI